MTEPTIQIEAWYRQYGEAVHRRATRILGDEALAWDATQETFVRAFKSVDKFRGESSVLTWLFAIVDRRCFSLLASRRSQQSRAEQQASESLVSTPPPSMEEALGDADLLRYVLSRVDDDSRQVAVLRYLDELEQEEVARALGISRKTVQRQLERFQKSARKVLHLADPPPGSGA